MDSFDDRKRAAEGKFAHDANLRFRAEARRNKLVGLWAASKLGLKDDQANAYAKEVVAADFVEAGDADVVRKIAADFAAKGVKITDTEIRKELDNQLVVAVEQIAKEG